MQRDDLVRQAARLLDAVLVPVGFAEAQGVQPPNHGGNPLWCAGHDELSERCPWLPQAWQQGRGTTACIDLTISFDSRGRPVGAELEALALTTTLREAGLVEEADAVEGVLGGDPGAEPTEHVAVLARVLEQLFSRS